MFTLKHLQAIYNLLLTISDTISTDVYVYLEDTNEIINIQQRHWDRSEENIFFPNETVKALVPIGLQKIDKEFVISLWIAATNAIGIKYVLSA